MTNPTLKFPNLLTDTTLTGNETYAETVARLKDALGRLRRSRIACGQILVEFHDSIAPTKRREATETLAHAAGMNRRSAFIDMQLYRDARHIGSELLEMAVAAGIDVDVPRQRRLLSETRSNLRRFSAETIIERAKEKIELASKKKSLRRNFREAGKD